MFHIEKNIIKKLEAVTNNPLIMIYINKIENRITFKIKTGYYPELLSTIISKIQESCIHLF